MSCQNEQERPVAIAQVPSAGTPIMGQECGVAKPRVLNSSWGRVFIVEEALSVELILGKGFHR